jgi:hypothetical protein
MESPTDVLVEVHRVHVLSFIGYKGPGRLPFSTAWDLANRLRVRIEECCLLLEELADEGFVEPLGDTPNRLGAPLRLTKVGEGYLEWLRSRPSRSPRNWRPPLGTPSITAR